MFDAMKRMKSFQPFNNEDGTAIVSALLILMLLTFIALAATDTTINEKSMVRSEAIFEQNFSLAESAALEGIQKLANQSTDEVDELLVAKLTAASENKDLLMESDSEGMSDILKVLDTNNDGTIDKNDSLEASELGADSFRAAVLLPINSGDSLSVTSTKSRLYRYNSFGLAEGQNGKILIRIGYKKRINN
jgi:hypothetical protein